MKPILTFSLWVAIFGMMNRTELLAAAEFYSPHEGELRLAIFHCMNQGINSDECMGVWNSVWSSEKKKRDARLIMALIQSAARNAQQKGKWMESAASTVEIRNWPAAEWMVRDNEKLKAIQRWVDAGGRTHGPAERMIASQFDPIWAKVSDYGIPWSEPMILAGRDYLAPLGRKDLEGIGLIYSPIGWVADALEMEERRIRRVSENSGARNMDPAMKKRLLEELRKRPKPKDPKESAREAAFQARRFALENGLEKAKKRILQEITNEAERIEMVRGGRLARERHDAILGHEDQTVEQISAELSTLREDFEKRWREEDEQNRLRSVPMNPPVELEWTGDPINPREFEDVNPVFPISTS